MENVTVTIKDVVTVRIPEMVTVSITVTLTVVMVPVTVLSRHGHGENHHVTDVGRHIIYLSHKRYFYCS